MQKSVFEVVINKYKLPESKCRYCYMYVKDVQIIASNSPADEAQRGRVEGAAAAETLHLSSI